MTEPAPAAAPVLPLFIQGAFGLPQAKDMERLTAYLAEDKLWKSHTDSVRTLLYNSVSKNRGHGLQSKPVT